jgi:hypothetical protein
MKKSCFSCKKDLPLKKFKSIPDGNYQQKSWLGVAICCRNCNIKRELKNGVVRRLNGRFEVLKYTKKEIIFDNLIK